MNLFEIVKASVHVPETARMYGLTPDRHGMVRCPFHEDRHPSLKLNEDYFYCFGCGATGDVIDLVSKLFGLSSYEAAKKIAADFGIDPDHPPTDTAPQKPKYSMTRAFHDNERYCQRVLCDYLHLLKDWKAQYAPNAMEDQWDDRLVEACQMLDYIEYLADLLTFGDESTRVMTTQKLMQDNTIGGLEEKIRRDRERKRGEMTHVKDERIAG